MRMRSFLIACLTISLLLGGCGKKTEEIPQTPLERAYHFADQYNFPASDSAFALQEQEVSGQPWASFSPAMAAERGFLYWDALPGYYKLADRFPDFLPAQEGKARIVARLGYPEVAASLLREALDTAAGSAATLYELGRYLVASEEYSAAMSAFDRARELGLGEASASFERAAALVCQQKRDSARLVAATGFEVPDSTAVYFQSGADYYEALGQIDSAMQWSRRASVAANAGYDVRTEHFFRSLRLKHFYDARRYIYGEVERGADDSIIAGMDIFYYMAADEPMAAKRANDLLCFYKLSWASCNGYLLWTYPATFEFVTPAQLRAEVYTKLLTEDKSPGFNRFARFYFEMKIVEWLAASQRDIELDKISGEYAERPEVVMAEMHVMRSIGDFDRYDKRVTVVSNDHARDAEWMELFGDHFGHREAKNWRRVEEFYRKSLEVDSYNRSAFIKLVELFRYLHRWDDALRLFDDFPHFAQLYPEEAVRRAVCLVNSGQGDAGMEAFSASIGLLRGNLTYFERVFDQCRLDYHQARARSLAELCVMLNGDNADALIFVAKIYGWLNDFETALSVAHRAQEIEPQSLSAKAQVAYALYRTGKTDEAIKLFDEILEIDRDHVEANLYFSRALASDQLRTSDAQNMARTAAGDSMLESEAWLNLIYVYQQCGRYDLARGEAIKASQKFQATPMPLYYLGVSNLNLGKLDEVKEPLEAAIAFGLKGPELEEARTILSRL